MTNELISTELYMGFDIEVYAEDPDYEYTGFFCKVTISGDELVDFDSGVIYNTQDDAIEAAKAFIEEIY